MAAQDNREPDISPSQNPVTLSKAPGESWSPKQFAVLTLTHARKTIFSLFRWLRAALSWLIIRELTRPLATIAVAATGWYIAHNFQNQQLDLDTKSRLAEQLDKLADSNKRRVAIPALVQFAQHNAQLVVQSLLLMLDDRDDEVRQACFRALEAIENRALVVQLLEQELRQNASHSEGVPTALIRLSGAKAFAALKDSFQSDTRLASKASCATAMAATKQSQAVLPLTFCMEDTTVATTIRNACLDGLGFMAPSLNDSSSKEVAKKLRLYLYDLHPNAVRALLNFRNLSASLDVIEKRTLVAVMLRALKDGNMEEEQLGRFAEVMGDVGEAKDLPALRDLLARYAASARVAKRLLDSMFKLGKSCALPHARAALKQGQVDWRIQDRLEWWEKELGDSCNERN